MCAKYTPGVLVETDASIHAIIVRIDQENKNDFIIEDIDDENLLIKKDRYELLKSLLHAVSTLALCGFQTG